MNQKDVDQMLERHKRDLTAMDEVLQEEQSRQMEIMRERMKNRNAAKAKEAEQAKLYEQAGGDLAVSIALEK